MKKWYLVLLVALLFSCSLLLNGCVSSRKNNTAGIADTNISNTKKMEETWGIQIAGIRQTAKGLMLDFRYRVVDPEKAAPLFKRKSKPYLIHQKSGATFIVPNPPKTGLLRNSNKPKQGIVYWMFFGNPEKYVKPGDKVTVVIGDFKAENLIVE